MSGMSNHAAGAMEYIKGKLQRVVGKHTGDRSMQMKGFGNQSKGGGRYEAGKAEGAFNDLKKD
jgi:uncharacterized protein YjbJ (UPF0337 family)